MNERLLTIVKAMAGGEMEYNDMSGIYCCLYCCVDHSPIRQTEIATLEVAHKADCPVTLAQQYLQENALPMNIYKMSGVPHKRKRAISWHTLATSQEEAIQAVEKEGRCTNIRAEFIKPLEIVIAE